MKYDEWEKPAKLKDEKKKEEHVFFHQFSTKKKISPPESQ